MEKEATTPRPVCAQEALALLNCAAENPYDREKCLSLLDGLRECIAQKHLFAPKPPSAHHASGYRVPELVVPCRPTFMSDMYSLSVLFLEILTGKCPTTGTAGVDGCGGAALDLSRWVYPMVQEEWMVEVFDQELVRLGRGTGEEMVALLQVAMACADTMLNA